MFPYLRLALTLQLACACFGVQSLLAQPLRLASSAFGVEVEVEVRDLVTDKARAAAEAALREVHTLSRLADADGPHPEGIGALNRAAGQGHLRIDLRASELLLRGLQFCIWSNGAFGPLGGELYELWGSLREQNLRPSVGDLRSAVGSAECSRLALRSDDPQGSGVPSAATAQLAGGTRVDLRGIARGFAVDRAVEILESHGARNVWVEVGQVWRARGEGPEGRGWLAVLPPTPGGEDPLDRIWLRDQAVAILSLEAVEDGPWEPYIDQRSGVPANGVVSVIAVTELAVDAEPLASALYVLGHREGHMRLGALEPRPSIYWLLGQGTGQPLEATYRWSELERIWRR